MQPDRTRGRLLVPRDATRISVMGRPADPRAECERFWSYVDRSGGPDACWPWTGGRDGKGYGAFSLSRQRRNVIASRYAYAYCYGQPVLNVLHQCDNPPCCNPRHLREGSLSDNSQDAVRRRRFAFGERNHMARLSDADVAEIRATARSGRAAASFVERFGVSRTTVYRIWAGRIRPATG